MPFQNQRNRPRLSPLAAWVVFSVLCSCVGWILSALHELNVTGYAVALGMGMGGALLWKIKTGATFICSADLKKLFRRFRRPLPLGFAVLAGLAILGGILYPGTNHDALSYRIPRVFHWLAAGQWHWIHTAFPRLNDRGCGIEWISAPLIVFTRTTRLLFLINAVSFLLLPGLVFSVFTKLGVRPRVAWCWMWIVPTGYCYLLQAGSIGNDLFGAVFPLAALHWALRARRSGNYRDLLLSILAAGLISSGKASNLPLMLPWFIAFVPSIRVLRGKWVQLAAACAAAAAASFLPNAVLNYHYARDWSGGKLEGEPILASADTFLRPVWNVLPFTVANFTPPVFPLANKWNSTITNYIPPGLDNHLLRVFEADQAHLQVTEMQVEECAGVGFGVSMLLLASVVGTLLLRRRHSIERVLQPAEKRLRRWIRAGIGVAIFAYILAMGMGIARLITPYYAFIIPLILLCGDQGAVIKMRWWKAGVAVVFALALLLVVVSPARPLWPARTILARLPSNSRWVSRARTVYEVYADRANGFRPAIEALPPGTRLIGMITFDDSEAAFWEPLWSRRVEHVIPTDSGQDIRERGIKYILVSSEKFAQSGQSFDEWLKRVRGEIIRVVPMTLRASKGPVDWYLVRLQD